MMNVAKVLKSFDIDPNAGVQRAVMNVGELITQSSDPLSVANSVLVAFGGAEELSFPEARIKAKALVQRAVEDGEQFDSEKALEFAESKVVELVRKQPELKVEVESAKTQPAKAAGKRGRPGTKTADGSSLKEKALAICKANATLTNAQLAQLISKELKLTYSNSYYYSSRVFSRG